mmetsp:Transcript_37582/g.69285  ORF Transcript_37582/g.69285 Transcript_37582/m.69285 type:complete len:337 (-) Transcript_37582:352-1362(-)
MHSFFYTRKKGLERKMAREASQHVSSPEALEKWLAGQMAQLPAHSHVTDVPLLEALDRALAIPGNLSVFLSSILKDDELVKKIASRSYHQDLFDKVVLFSGDTWKLRMHVFEAATFSQAQEEIHSHRDHFVSYCVHGGIVQQIWEEIDPHAKMNEEQQERNEGKSSRGGAPETAGAVATTAAGTAKATAVRPSSIPRYHKYEYDPTVSNGTRVFKIKSLGKVFLGPVDDEQKARAGQTYYMHPSVLHSVEGIEGKTVTLVLNRRATSKSCFASPEPWEETFVRRKISPEQLRARISEVLELMKKGDSSVSNRKDNEAKIATKAQQQAAFCLIRTQA